MDHQGLKACSPRSPLRRAILQLHTLIRLHPMDILQIVQQMPCLQRPRRKVAPRRLRATRPLRRVATRPCPWALMATTNLRSSQLFRNPLIVLTAGKRQNNSSNSILSNRSTRTTSWETSAMGRRGVHIAARLLLAEAWVHRVQAPTGDTPVMVWPAPLGNGLQRVRSPRRRRPPGARTASRGCTRWTIIPIGGLSSTSC